MEITLTLILTIWYIVGAICFLLALYIDYKTISYKDLFVSLTLGGLAGVISVIFLIIAIADSDFWSNDFWDRKII